jgi:ABC-type nitrate/sulfonate/bicarbonate transport system permease component
VIARIFTAIVLLFLIAPIVVIFPLSFSSGELLTLPTPGWSWRWYRDFFGNAQWLLATRNSFIVGIATMILATLLGTLCALGIFLGRFRGKAFLIALLTTPMVVPVIVTAVAIYFGFSFVGLNNTLTGLVLAHTVLSVPYVLLTVLATLTTFDRNLLKAAATCGAPPHVAFTRVVLPLIAPAWRQARSSHSRRRSTSWSWPSSCRARAIHAAAPDVRGAARIPEPDDRSSRGAAHRVLGAAARRQRDAAGASADTHDRRRSGRAQLMADAIVTFEKASASRTTAARASSTASTWSHARRVPHAARTVGLGQDDHAHDARGLRGPDVGHDHARRQEIEPRSGAPPRHRHGVPELRAVSRT